MSDQHLARKRFGQNFLSDPNIIRKIIEAIRPCRATAWSRSAPASAR
jgi:16S rRNA A1518/A1519 N6-dimethyltransferase RsmA/KsgA/DIM1 with predicted DNA glycosylase/AP lyase activity